MSDLLIPSFLVSNVRELLSSLTKNEQMSKWLVFLSELLIRSFFAKPSDSLRKPMSEFPALNICYFVQHFRAQKLCRLRCFGHHTAYVLQAQTN